MKKIKNFIQENPESAYVVFLSVVYYFIIVYLFYIKEFPTDNISLNILNGMLFILCSFTTLTVIKSFINFKKS